MWAGMWAYLSDIDIQNIPHQLTELASEMPILRSVVIGFGLILSSILTALYILQEKIIYLPTIPTREYERTPEDYGLRYVDVEIVTEDDVKLHGWLILQEEDNAISRNRPTFLYMHGNAGNISHRLPDARFYHASGFNVLMLSYRGYGCSEGSPSEPGFKKDAEAALTYLMDRGDVIDTDRLFVFGRSIGGAVAIALASSESGNGNDDGEDRIKGLVVENTFTCINDMINEVFPILRFVKPLNRNKWNSLSIIKDIKIPILFLRFVCFYCL